VFAAVVGGVVLVAAAIGVVLLVIPSSDDSSGGGSGGGGGGSGGSGGSGGTTAPTCEVSASVGADRIRIQDQCTTLKLGGTGRRLAEVKAAKVDSKAYDSGAHRTARSLFVSDMYRSSDQSKSDKVTTEVWDEKFAAYWWDAPSSINANMMPQSRWDSMYAGACNQSGPVAGCPLFYETDTDGDGFIDDIRNFSGTSLLPLIADKIYNGYVWEDMAVSQPGYDCQQWMNVCTLDECKNTDGSPMTYNGSIEAHAMICSVKGFADGMRYMDPTTVQEIDVGDGQKILGVADADHAPCDAGSVKPLRQDLYSGLYIQIIAHLYNKFVVGNGSPGSELTVELKYHPRKLSTMSYIHDIPCVPIAELQAATNSTNTSARR
jgi:hypothetical protein